MSKTYEAVRVTEHVYWIGAIDWDLREFHGYRTERGTTYNAFLVVGDAITLIDTVKAPFMPEMWARIASVCDPADVRYIVSNHAEMDHSGGLPEAIERIRPEKVLASANGVKALEAHFGPLPNLEAVADGASLSLGDLTLAFYETRMLHWPDSMVTYLAEDKLLLSQDAFGMHLASKERFADELDAALLEFEAAKYFANILLPYAGLIPKALNKLGGLDVAVIAPDHGPFWRTEPEKVLGWYARWADQKPAPRVVIVYDTMWGSTDKMARAIEEGVTSAGVQAVRLSLHEASRAQVATELLEAGALVVGSPTMNNNVFPTVADIMTYLKGLRPKNLVGAAFGSYGWGGEAVKHLTETLIAMKIDLVHEGLAVLYVPDEAALTQCRDLGQTLAERVKALCAEE